MTPEQERVYKLGKLLGWTPKLGCWLDEDRKIVCGSSWNPFNNVHDAMIAFQNLRKSGFWCCLKIDCDYNYATYITLTPSGFIGGRFDREEEHEPVITVQESEGGIEDLAALICQAVIEAKDYERVYKQTKVQNTTKT